jgi:hypothetical protein
MEYGENMLKWYPSGFTDYSAMMQKDLDAAVVCLVPLLLCPEPPSQTPGVGSGGGKAWSLTRGKLERPFFYLEQQFIGAGGGLKWVSFSPSHVVCGCIWVSPVRSILRTGKQKWLPFSATMRLAMGHFVEARFRLAWRLPGDGEPCGAVAACLADGEASEIVG